MVVESVLEFATGVSQSTVALTGGLRLSAGLAHEPVREVEETPHVVSRGDPAARLIFR